MSAVQASTEGRKPLTGAQRQATHRQRKAVQAAAWRIALEAIGEAPTLGQARKLAWAALATGAGY